MKTVSKKALVTGSLVVLLLVSAYLNYRYNGAPADADGSGWPASVATASPSASLDPKASLNPSATPGTKNTDADADFFATFKTDRQSTREEEMAQLDTIIKDEKTDEETRKQAQAKKMDLVDAMDQTLIVENLLKAKGFADAAVTLHRGAVNVILSAESLTEEQVAQVLDIVMRETGEPAESVKVTTAQ